MRGGVKRRRDRGGSVLSSQEETGEKQERKVARRQRGSRGPRGVGVGVGVRDGKGEERIVE